MRGRKILYLSGPSGFDSGFSWWQNVPVTVESQSGTAGLKNGFISKSLYLDGLQCPRLAWFRTNAPEKIPPPDADAQFTFAQANGVGILAHRLFPNGMLATSGPLCPSESVERTRPFLSQRRPLFEAAFAYDGCYARTDILAPSEGDSWNLLEVKASNSANETQLRDLAFQNYVLTGAGIKLKCCSLLILDGNYARHGEVVPQDLFVECDCMAEMAECLKEVGPRVSTIRKAISLQEPPESRIGPHCTTPFECPLRAQCWSFLPEQNVTELHRARQDKKFELLHGGVIKLADIPVSKKLTPQQRIQKTAAISGKPHVSRLTLSLFLARLQYPLSFFDFETFSTAVPMFDGVRPWQQVPFQFSVHVVTEPDSKPTSHAFLADGQADPRPELLARLREAIGETGSLVAYHAGFERDRLRECAEALPDHAEWVAQALARVVDLEDPFKAFNCYFPSQCGSTSLKAVLPALTGNGYEGLPIQNGTGAAREFLRVTFGGVSAEERQRVREALLEYCGLDTLGMVWIVDALRALSRSGRVE